MNPLLYCLSIMPLNPTNQTPPPVLEIVQSHIVKEFKRTTPQLMVNFGIASCPNVIHYEEALSSLILKGNTAQWSGLKEVLYTDALAERSIDFGENLVPISALHSELKAEDPSPRWKSWAIWTGVGLAAAGTAYLLSQRNNESRKAPTGIALKGGIKF